MPNTLDLFSLTGRTALTTGASRGIGQALALALAEAGADIILIQRPGSQNNETKTRIQQLGRQATVYEADLAKPDDMRGLVKRITDDGHDVSILVNSGGIQRRHLPHEFPDEDWDEVLQVNLNAVFTLCRDVGAYMLSRSPQGSPPHRGSIINIASIASFQGAVNVCAYAATKGGVAQLTKALSNQWASEGINVNAIAPGYIKTDMIEALVNDEQRSKGILNRIPAGRWGLPDDFKGAIVYLASRASLYVNGEILTVDGGWLGR